MFNIGDSVYNTEKLENLNVRVITKVKSFTPTNFINPYTHLVIEDIRGDEVDVSQVNTWYDVFYICRKSDLTPFEEKTINITIKAEVSISVTLRPGETVEDVLNRDVDIYLHNNYPHQHHMDDEKEDLGCWDREITTDDVEYNRKFKIQKIKEKINGKC